jgi:lipoprotein-anchoring transpeptidase ErfK/SrfK
MRNIGMKHPRLISLVGIVVLAVLALSGCAPSNNDAVGTPKPPVSVAPTSTPPPSVGTAATAIGPSVDVYAEAGGAVVSTLSNPQPSGAPLTLLVATSKKGWLQVSLPQRPNGSTGWIRADAVTLNRLEYRLVASTENNTLTLYRNTDLVSTFTAATGTGGTPTPHGSFYLTELLAPTNSGYGPYAFGLSAYSDVLSSFGGGPGQIGLHGTDDAASIGRSASHGCIRLSNADITTLAKLLPLGTPITIE